MATTQTKKGYLYGCKKAVLTELNADGSTPATPTTVTVDTPTTIGISVQIKEGEKVEHRGGDILLVEREDDDIVTGVDLDYSDARANYQAQQLMFGGTLKTTGVEPDIVVIGWTPPTISEQAAGRPRFMMELYIQNLNAQGELDGYLKRTFGYCKATPGDSEHQDQNFATPGATIKARENPSTGAPPYEDEFVELLP